MSASTKQTPAPKPNLADGLFGPEHSDSESPIFIERESSYPPWTQDYPTMRRSLKLPMSPATPTAKKQKRSGHNEPRAEKPIKNPRVVRNVFWTITFCIALVATSPMLLPAVKNYSNKAITIITDGFGAGEEAVLATQAQIQIQIPSISVVVTTNATPTATGRRKIEQTTST